MQKSGATIVKVCHTGFIFPDGKYRKALSCEVSGQWVNDPGQECEPGKIMTIKLSSTVLWLCTDNVAYVDVVN